MFLLGITGGVGMGKSTSRSLLEERGVPVVDTDQLARFLVEPGQPASAEILECFGERFIHPDGSLKRPALAKLVFSDSEARKRLESILHPRIRCGWLAEVARWRAAGVSLGAVIIPLLFETNAESCFDSVVCVACSPRLQLERLGERGWTEEETQQRLDAQWPVEQKMALANQVIWTDGTLEVHAAQWGRMLRSL